MKILKRIYIIPVSYTHLDVYKRQAFGVGCRSPPYNLDFSKKFRLEVKRSGI